MATQYPDLFAALAAPFSPGDVKTREQGGRQLSYITARTAMNRLDNVLGPENWEDEYYSVCDVLFCRITITLPDGRKVSKSDAGGFKTMTTKERGQTVEDEENTDKTGPSDAFKRAAVLLGVGRYLYRDGVPDFAHDAKAPQRPQQAPQQRQQANSQPQRQQPQGAAPERPNGPPRTGKALFAWCKEQSTRFDWRFVDYLNDWGKDNGVTGLMKDWTESQVAAAYKVGATKVAELSTPAYPMPVMAGGDDEPQDEDIPF